MTQTNAVKKAVAKYDKTNTQGLYIKLHKTKDKDIIDKLESVESKQGYIKGLIRRDIPNELIIDDLVIDKITVTKVSADDKLILKSKVIDLIKDCISRKEAINEAELLDLETFYDNEKVIEMLKELPSIQLQ